MKKIVLLLFAVLFSSNAQENTRWDIIGKIGMNINEHNSQDIRFDNICQECFKLSSGSGIGLLLSGGIGYRPEERIFGIKYYPMLDISYTNLSGKFEGDYIANLISGNQVSKAKISFTLDNSIALLSFSPKIYFYPFESIPSAFSIGFTAGIPIQKKYILSEILNTPNVTYPDGSTSKPNIEGDIPNNSSILFSLPIGVSYDILKNKSWRMTTEINYSLALNDFHKDSKWNINPFNIGLSVAYSIPKEKAPEPVLPPIPELPAPPQETHIASSSQFYINNQETVKDFLLSYNTNIYYFEQISYPIFFFDNNESDIKENIETAQYISFFDAVKKIKSNEINPIEVKVIVTALDDEDENVLKERKNSIKKLFHGAVSGELTIETKIVNSKKLRYDELKEENRFAYIQMKDNSPLIYKSLQKEENIFDSPKVKININAESEAGIESISGNVKINNKDYQVFNSNTLEFYIPAFDVNSKTEISLNYEVTDKSSNTKEFSKVISITPKQANTKVITNLDFLEEFQGKEFYLLAYNEFDKFNSYLIHPNAKEIIEKAKAENKTIRILGLTDNLGSSEHNQALAEKRTNYIINKLGVSLDNISIEHPVKGIFPNSDPLGRLMNRSVILIIK